MKKMIQEKAEAASSASAITHTPGPWRAAQRGTHWWFVETAGESNLTIAEMYHEANAALMAAAPDMLAALKAAVRRADMGLKNYSGRTPECQADYDACVAAIRKAEGKEG